MKQLYSKASKALGICKKKGVQAAEVYAERRSIINIEINGGKFRSLSEACECGIGIRTIQDGAIGFAYTSDLDDNVIKSTVHYAYKLAQRAYKDDHNEFSRETAANSYINNFDRSLEAITLKDKIAITKNVTGGIKCRMVKATLSNYHEEIKEVYLLNTNGVSNGYKAGYCAIAILANLYRKGCSATTIAFTHGPSPAKLDTEKVKQEIKTKLTDLRKVKRDRASRLSCPVVFSPLLTSYLMSLIAAAASADAILNKKSFLATLRGEKIASPLITLVDFGGDDSGTRFMPFDGEGTPARRTVLIENGVLKSWLHSVYTAKVMGEVPTGNAVRLSFRHLPYISSTNLRLAEGTDRFDELVQEIPQLFYAEEGVGGNFGLDLLTGNLSLGLNGVLVLNGEATTVIEDVPLHVNVIDLLNNVKAIGTNYCWIPSTSVCAPSILVDGIAIGKR